MFSSTCGIFEPIHSVIFKPSCCFISELPTNFLHNASETKLNELNTVRSLIQCVSTTVADSSIISSSICDDQVTDMIVKHELDNNQTMIKVAYAFLKTKGIQ